MVGHFFGFSLLPQALERLGPKQHAVDAFPPVQLDGMREQRKHQGHTFRSIRMPVYTSLAETKLSENDDP